MVKRNPYLVKKAMSHFLVATILTMAAGQIGVIIDGIIVSHLVGPDALSAINLYTPISLLVTSFSTFLGIGATILAARAIGERNKTKAEGFLSTAFASLVVVGTLLGIAAYAFQDSVVAAICKEERLAVPFRSYMLVMVGGCMITMLNSLFNEMVCIDGHPQVATKSVAVSAACNIVLAYLFVGVFHWGIAGSAWASLVCSVLNMAIISKYIFGKRCSFRLRPLKAFSGASLRLNIQQGTPLIIGNLILTALFFFLNNIIQDKQGADGMFAMSICMNLLTIGMLISGSVGSTCLSVGGFLYGQRDFDGLSMLIGRCVRFMLVVLVVLTAVIEVAPGLISGLFGADTPELAEYSNHCLRIFAWMLPFILMVLLLANIYQMLGHLALAPVVIALFPAVLLPSLLLWGMNDGSLIWYAFPVTGIIVFAVTLFISEMIRRKGKVPASRLTLVPKESSSTRFSASITPDLPSMNAIVGEAFDFMKMICADAETASEMRLCLEEMLLNIIEHGNVGKDKYIDVAIYEDGDAVTLAIKDDGRAFNPLLVDENKLGVGLALVGGLCPGKDYKNMYGQNMTFLTWK